MFYVYIIYSENLDKYYIGQTNSIRTRLKQHNAGHEKYTSKGIPWQIIWFTKKSTRSEAMILEKKLKNLNRMKLQKFIKKYSKDQDI